MKVAVLSVVTDVLRPIPKGLAKGVEDLDIRGEQTQSGLQHC